MIRACVFAAVFVVWPGTVAAFDPFTIRCDLTQESRGAGVASFSPVATPFASGARFHQWSSAPEFTVIDDRGVFAFDLGATMLADVQTTAIIANVCHQGQFYDIRIDRTNGQIWARAIGDCVAGAGNAGAYEEFWGQCSRAPYRAAERQRAF